MPTPKSITFSAADVTNILTDYLLEDKPAVDGNPNPYNWFKFDDRVWTAAGAAPITFTVTATKKSKSKTK